MKFIEKHILCDEQQFNKEIGQQAFQFKASVEKLLSTAIQICSPNAGVSFWLKSLDFIVASFTYR